jgi:predicted ATPase with chaperone activity
METWQLITGLIITAGAVIGAMKVIVAPIKKRLDKIVSNEERVSKLESWTEKQQSDLEDVSQRVALVFNASLALLDHAIIKQDGNGKCHDAQKAMNNYIQEKLERLQSYGTGGDK